MEALISFFNNYGSFLDFLLGLVAFGILWFRTRKNRMQSLDKTTQEKFKTFLDLLLSNKTDEDKK